MVRCLFVFAMILQGSVLVAQNRVTIAVQGIRGTEGSLMVALFDNQVDFLKNAREGKIVPVDADSMQVIFTDIPPGAYGVSVIHDRNNNGRLDTNALGIPTEGIAFGNNATGFFGPPSFRKSALTIGEGNSHHVVDLKYY